MLLLPEDACYNSTLGSEAGREMSKLECTGVGELLLSINAGGREEVLTSPPQTTALNSSQGRLRSRVAWVTLVWPENAVPHSCRVKKGCKSEHE